jgi:hypothetical protein
MGVLPVGRLVHDLVDLSFSNDHSKDRKQLAAGRDSDARSPVD